MQRSSIEASTRSTATAAAATAERMSSLIDAMGTQLELAKQARADAARSERFTRIMAWCSLFVAVASLGAAVAAIVVAG
ncbi:hypothetical protein [Microbacterium sp. CIAB417]|uniref:hypothetical protein n=1 Tax=Microbacterium sp. CIAB417 TaxID=2860287 RepID=UPI001FAE6628|nr:hypothetical protein [Microbacterium sp. CIAB417]